MIPVIGSFLFIILYLVAALLYPGGSQADKISSGYSLVNNYWCNLLYKTGINGLPNPGQPFAAAGVVVICFALSGFWMFFPIQIGLRKYHRLLIQISGLTAMIISSFLLTEFDHDLVINISSIFGLIAMIATLVALYKIKWQKLFVFGLFNIMLVGLNNYLYHTKGMIIYLPVVQKISFLSFLVWFCLISLFSIRQKVDPSSVYKENPVRF